MANNVLTDLYKGFGLKVDNRDFLRSTFFTFQGMFVGVALNEICNNFNLFWPTETLVINGHDTGIYKDFLVQTGIAVAIVLIGNLLDIKYSSNLGLGAVLGAKWADLSEHKQLIGILGLK